MTQASLHPPLPPRYRPLSSLGSGGMGSVTECHDTERDTMVALKTLSGVDPLALTLFKNEFRSLADLSHHNLVSLYELGQHDNQPFFTMEVVTNAVDILKHIRGASHESGRTWLSAMGDLDPDATLPPTPDAPVEQPSDLPPPSPLPEGAETRVRAVLAQLAEALSFLHANGKVHRDVKPSNVLIQPDGRLVLVDFGLVYSLDGASPGPRDIIAGSVPYMSPEQSIGAELGPASDWYAFGALLYELLTGRPPFAGARAAVLAAKRGRDVVPPDQVVSGIPEDLATLATALLRRDPTERPTESEILQALEVTSHFAPTEDHPLVGRSEEIEQLDQAALASRNGRPLQVHVRGPSGHGKSALLQHWASRLPSDTLVLQARCYERDGLPMKAIDPLIDQLVQWWRTLPDAQARILVPQHANALSKMFPVLHGVTAMAQAVDRYPNATDPQELQRRARHALRDLFGRIASQRAMVVIIDDLQWTDSDSIHALRTLLRPPDPPLLLLVLAYRPAAAPPAVHELSESGSNIDIGPLSDVIALPVIAARIPDPSLRDEVLRQAQGIPFYIHALAREAVRSGSAPSLDSYVRQQVEALPPTSADLIRLLALAGTPLKRSVLQAALPDCSQGHYTLLQTSRLIQSGGPTAEHVVSCSHDQVREGVVAHCPAEDAARLHTRIGEALIDTRGAAERISTHLMLGGDPIRAAQYARTAAIEARQKLAFPLEAEMWRRQLDLVPATGDSRVELLEHYARALENTGENLRAADAFAAAFEVGGRDHLELLAATNYTCAGRLEQGRALAKRSLHALGVVLPNSRWTMVIRFSALRLWRMAFPLRPGNDRPVDDRQYETLSQLLNLSWFFAYSDILTSGYLGTRLAPAAIRSGRPDLIVLALLNELGAAVAYRPIPAVKAMEQQAAPYLPLCGADTILFYRIVLMMGFFQAGLLERARQATKLARQQFSESSQRLDLGGWIRMFEGVLLGVDGDLKGYREAIEETSSVARARNDNALFVNIYYGTLFCIDLLDDRPDKVIQDVAAQLPRHLGATQRFYLRQAAINAMLYKGAIGEASTALLELEHGLKKEHAILAGADQVQLALLRAKVALEQGLPIPRKAKRQLEKKADLGEMWLPPLRAVEAWHRTGDTATCVRDLQAHEERMGRSHSHLLMRTLQFARARLTNDTELEQASIAWTRSQGIQNPTAWLRFNNPGLRHPTGIAIR